MPSLYHFNSDQYKENLMLGSQQHMVTGRLCQYLKGWQLDGLRFLYKHIEKGESCILNDESGLGKVVTVSVLLGAILTNDTTKKCLIVVRDDEYIEGWRFHLSVLTQLTVKVIEQTSDINHETVFLVKWSTLKNIGQITKVTFDHVIIDNRGEMLTNKFCTGILLRYYENKTSLVISSSDVTANIKLLHILLRLCGRLDKQYSDVKNLEDKFQMPKLKDGMCSKLDLEDYFLKREKVINFCREFRLRRYCHQFDEEFPLVSSSEFKKHLQQWRTNSENTQSSGSVKLMSSSSEKDTEELFKEYFQVKEERDARRLDSEVQKIIENMDVENEELEVSDEVVVMSPLLFVSDSESDSEQVQVQIEEVKDEGDESDSESNIKDVETRPRRKARKPVHIKQLPERKNLRSLDQPATPIGTRKSTVKKVVDLSDKRERKSIVKDATNKQSKDESTNKIEKKKAADEMKKDRPMEDKNKPTKPDKNPKNAKVEEKKPTEGKKKSIDISNAKSVEEDKGENKRTFKVKKCLRVNLIKDGKEKYEPAHTPSETKQSPPVTVTEADKNAPKKPLTLYELKMKIKGKQQKENSHKKEKASKNEKDNQNKIINIVDRDGKSKPKEKSQKSTHKQTNAGDKTKLPKEDEKKRKRESDTDTLVINPPKRVKGEMLLMLKEAQKFIDNKNNVKRDTQKECKFTKSTRRSRKLQESKSCLLSAIPTESPTSPKKLNSTQKSPKTPEGRLKSPEDRNKSAKKSTKDDKGFKDRDWVPKRGKPFTVYAPLGVHSRSTRGMKRCTRATPTQNKYMKVAVAQVKLDKIAKAKRLITQNSRPAQREITKPTTVEKPTAKTCVVGASMQLGQALTPTNGSLVADFIAPKPKNSEYNYPLMLDKDDIPDSECIIASQNNEIIVLTGSTDNEMEPPKSTVSRRKTTAKQPMVTIPRPTYPKAKSPDLFSTCSDLSLPCSQQKSNRPHFEGFKIFGSELRQTGRSRSCLEILDRILEPSSTIAKKNTAPVAKENPSTSSPQQHCIGDEDAMFEITANGTFGTIVRVNSNGEMSPQRNKHQSTPPTASSHPKNRITNYLISNNQHINSGAPTSSSFEDSADLLPKTPKRQKTPSGMVKRSPRQQFGISGGKSQTTKLTQWLVKNSAERVSETLPKPMVTKRRRLDLSFLDD